MFPTKKSNPSYFIVGPPRSGKTFCCLHPPNEGTRKAIWLNAPSFVFAILPEYPKLNDIRYSGKLSKTFCSLSLLSYLSSKKLENVDDLRNSLQLYGSWHLGRSPPKCQSLHPPATDNWLASEHLANKKELPSWKAWPSKDYHDIKLTNHTCSPHSSTEKVIVVPSPEDCLFRKRHWQPYIAKYP